MDVVDVPQDYTKKIEAGKLCN